MSSVIEILEKNKGRTIISLELVPPLKSGSINELFIILEKLKKFSPAFVNITTHSSKYIKVKKSFLTNKSKKIKKRPATISIAAAIKNKFNLITVPHILCRGFTKISTENSLIELNYLGINDVLLLRGDKTNKHSYENKKKQLMNQSVLELIEQVNSINKGELLDVADSNFNSNFSYGVGGYPEKHPDARTIDEDIVFLKKKIELGAKYIITQFFFDNKYYFDFYDKCRQAGITVPIIPGIKILRNKKQLELLPKIFYTTIPAELKNKLAAAEDREEIEKIGAEWCVKQCRSLLDFGVPVIHFYTMSRVDGLVRVLSELKDEFNIG